MNGLFDQATTEDAEMNAADDVVPEPMKVVATGAPARWLPARYQDLGPIARGAFGEVRRVHGTLLDRGELTDGRLWFTMKEIRGRTLSDVIEELHSVSQQNEFDPTASGWTFRRLVDAFARVVQTVSRL